ncbi:class I SAM-dependent methyltransferase [Xanthovirga aplysinae]|uniref:class I SAM-dependent methyltransferase n=1 Tax=Xanthovirga aplysinae TaxID=2529853 RepID=UPI0012BD4C60|nr:class I SAM-dependent methyltransferase [Xanthovirga aplysinae]MTI30649.1 class I SAM-dependent methyltransferase [Xanthovirga aplysinae]
MSKTKKTLYSHRWKEDNLELIVQEIKERIAKEGNKPHVTVDRQLQILDEMLQFDFGRFLIQNKGLNGEWTDYFLCYPDRGKITHKNNRGEPFTPMEKAFLERFPTFVRNQVRFKVELEVTQKYLKEGGKYCAIPCGLMGELLYLDYGKLKKFELIGIDLDPDALDQAKALASKMNLLNHCRLIQEDAWSLKIAEEFDLVISNGLNVYVPEDEKVTALYRTFFKSLKKGGVFVTYMLPPPPKLVPRSEWKQLDLNYDDFLLEYIVRKDIVRGKFRNFRTDEKTKNQLQEAGFNKIEVIEDKVGIVSLFIAHKS